MNNVRALPSDEYPALSAVLGDRPEHVNPNHLLLHGWCRAFIAGRPEKFLGAVVDSDFEPGEPYCFGSDPKVLWRLLQEFPEMDCFQVDSPLAEAVGQLFAQRNGWQPRYLDQIVLTLTVPVAEYRDQSVRLLAPEDADLMRSAPGELGGIGFSSPEQMLTEGFAAAAIVNGRIVSSAFTAAITAGYVDVGIRTAEDHRERGLATAAASLVIRQVQRAGKMPVWLTYENNPASRTVARKLGFQEVTRKMDVFFHREKSGEGRASS
jgi:hypothetical protein